MKVAILDDYSDTLRTLNCFRKLDSDDVTIGNDHVDDLDLLSDRLREAEALVLTRERTRMSATLLERFPGYESSASGASIRISMSRCARGLESSVSSDLQASTRSYATAVLTWRLVLATMRQIPRQMAALTSGDMADRCRPDAARPHPRHLR
jgi:D-3-phosphoglycerate dehydrogenase